MVDARLSPFFTTYSSVEQFTETARSTFPRRDGVIASPEPASGAAVQAEHTALRFGLGFSSSRNDLIDREGINFLSPGTSSYWYFTS